MSLERSFDAHLCHVQIHSDARAVAECQALGVTAFTIGDGSPLSRCIQRILYLLTRNTGPNPETGSNSPST